MARETHPDMRILQEAQKVAYGGSGIEGIRAGWTAYTRSFALETTLDLPSLTSGSTANIDVTVPGSRRATSPMPRSTPAASPSC
jgi:hypothetical protein